RVGGHPALARQKTVGQHDQCEVPMQPIPAPALIVVQPTLALRVFIELLNGPAAVGQLDQPPQRRIRGQVTVIAQFITVCSSSILAETLGYAVSISSPWHGKRRVFEWCKPVLIDQLQPSTNTDKLSVCC